MSGAVSLRHQHLDRLANEVIFGKAKELAGVLICKSDLTAFVYRQDGQGCPLQEGECQVAGCCHRRAPSMNLP